MKTVSSDLTIALGQASVLLSMTLWDYEGRDYRCVQIEVDGDSSDNDMRDGVDLGAVQKYLDTEITTFGREQLSGYTLEQAKTLYSEVRRLLASESH